MGVAIAGRGAVAAVLVASVCLSGCTGTVAGTAVRAQGGAGQGQLLAQSALVMLDQHELNAALDSTLIEVSRNLSDMTDDSDTISESRCLGAVYTAEEPVYEDTGYSGVHTRLASDPHIHGVTVEQTAVILPSVAAAETFVDDGEGVERLHVQGGVGLGRPAMA